LTPREAARLRAALAIVRAQRARESPRPFIPQAPTPKQAEFLALDCLEALYGGAAGGGKSSALLMAALEHVHVPGYAALLLRRTFADLSLPGAVMDRAQSWLQGTGANWNERDKRWTFPSGATLTFGYCETARDVYRYQGSELQFIGVDELTQWPEQSYRYLLSRLRRLQGATVPVRARAASNPGGIGHDWVRRRFVEAADPKRRFVAAHLPDNPHVDAVEYRRSLAQLDENTRRQLEDGIWVRDAGGLVYRYDEARNQVAQAPALSYYLVGIDYGFTDATAFSVLGWRDNDPTVYVVEAYKLTGLTPSDAAEEAHRLSARYTPVKMVGDIGGLGKGYAEEARKRFSLPIEPAEKNNKRGYQSLLNGDLERGRVKVVGCPQLVAEWLELPWTEDHAKEAEGFDNHCADATLYAWRAASAYHEEPVAPLPTRAEVLAQQERDIWEKRAEAIERQASGNWWDA
jgi:hypothetical protein